MVVAFLLESSMEKLRIACTQADVWDVDGTGMQTVPDPKLAEKIRKVSRHLCGRLGDRQQSWCIYQMLNVCLMIWNNSHIDRQEKRSMDYTWCWLANE